ncbi:serine/threonine protein kinase [Polyangium aurulentum]|uniref:serine/threonine protein kinase n=1 Tax=Polyangium aurulentum TaxID=2567896 RepID=UPI00146E9E8D|nr:serine/threonine-protein kinase [Polyangium aurulentum]UQA55238.1 protein kinase [Polyangium aurulentum]
MEDEPSMSNLVAIGDVIADKYRVDSILGTGAMGVVVAATHLELRARRAIKVLLPHVCASPMAFERFLREARALSELRGAHVSHVYDVGRLESGEPFMIMEYLDGRTLTDVLAERGVLPPEEAALYALHACEALAEAHALGIVHRDLKPDNLYLTCANDGSPCVKVLDFGVSKLLGDEGPTMTTTGAIVGSPLYMSPEQINAARDVDGRCDIWSLGVILHQLVTGVCPFEGSTVLQVIVQIADKQLAPPSTLRPGLPPALDAIILRCLEKDISRRYQDVVELSRDLAQIAPASLSPTSLAARIERIHVHSARSSALVADRISPTEGSPWSAPAVSHVRAEHTDTPAALRRTVASTPAPAWARTGDDTAPGRAAPLAREPALSEPLTPTPRRSGTLLFVAVAAAMTVGAALGVYTYGRPTEARVLPLVSSLEASFGVDSSSLDEEAVAPRASARHLFPKTSSSASSVGVVAPASGQPSAGPVVTQQSPSPPRNRSTRRPPPRY